MRGLVLLVDDNALIRRKIRALFEAEDAFEVCGEAEHGQEAIEKALVLKPHLIVIDFQMPVMNGIDASRVVLTHLPEVVIILFTLFGDDILEKAARSVGIHAVVPKDKVHTLIPTAHTLLRRTRTNGHTATA
jgi:DNA-binding NarL/FixJ family response regulator